MLDDLSEIYGVLVLETALEKEWLTILSTAADANLISITPLAGIADNSDASGRGGELLLYMFFALMGGIILNLMPCVFPVLSIKALSFTKNIGESQTRQRMDGIVYTLGVISAFIVLASVLILLRAGGEAVGWAFQVSATFGSSFHCVCVFLNSIEFVWGL